MIYLVCFFLLTGVDQSLKTTRHNTLIIKNAIISSSKNMLQHDTIASWGSYKVNVELPTPAKWDL